MSLDSSRTYLHLHQNAHADLFEEFTRIPLLPDSIYLASQFQPVNPEDEDDVIPDQHAAFGIARAAASKETREPIWRDLRLDELLNSGGANATAGASTGLASLVAGPRHGSSSGGPTSGAGGIEGGMSAVGGGGSGGATYGRGLTATSVQGVGVGLRHGATATPVNGGVVAIGPASGGVRIPIAVRPGLRSVEAPSRQQ